ncbi:hypothetical protein [Rhodococcus triatomae]
MSAAPPASFGGCSSAPDVLGSGTLSDMLHLRILSPADMTDEALQILDEEPGSVGSRYSAAPPSARSVT